MKHHSHLKYWGLVVLCFSIMIVMSIGYMLYTYNICPKAEGFEYENYTIVIHNTSERVIEGLAVYYGGPGNDEELTGSYLYETIDELMPGKYRKVMISTTSPSPLAEYPFNVFLVMGELPTDQICSVGYFKDHSRDFRVVEIREGEQGLYMEQLRKNFKWHLLYWRDCRRQWETEW